MSINPPKLITFSNANFYSNPLDGSLIFYVPDHGATTPGSHYPRSELRELREWTMQGNKVHTLTGCLKILEVPASRKIVFSQIHGVVKGSECLIMRWDNGNITVHTKSTLGCKATQILSVPGSSLGDMIRYYIFISNYRLSVAVNGVVSTATFDDTWKDQNLYFKAGNYLQDNSNSGTFGKVAYYSLSDDSETSDKEKDTGVEL